MKRASRTLLSSHGEEDGLRHPATEPESQQIPDGALRVRFLAVAHHFRCWRAQLVVEPRLA